MGTNQSLRVILLTGDKRAGKTTWLQAHKSGAAGFLSPLIHEKRNFLLIPEKIVFPMEELGGQLLVGKYAFSSTAFAAVEEHVQNHFQSEELIFDEIGPLEIRGEGFADLLRNVLQNYSGNLLIVLRTGLVSEAIKAFDLDRFPLTVVDYMELKNSENPTLIY
jgi:nucleoside-triphosphatase THEP1